MAELLRLAKKSKLCEVLFAILGRKLLSQLEHGIQKLVLYRLAKEIHRQLKINQLLLFAKLVKRINLRLQSEFFRIYSKLRMSEGLLKRLCQIFSEK